MMQNTRSKTLVAGLALIFFLAGLISCQKEGPQTPDDLDAVVTQFDTAFDFGTVKYYLMPDTVIVENADSTYQKTDDEINYEQNILDQVSAQMGKKGYIRLTFADTSDQTLMSKAVMLFVTRSTENVQNTYYYDYYNGYGGYNYYNSGYSYGYSYPWSYPVTSSYTVGTVIIRMVDPRTPVSLNDQQGSANYPVRWMAVLNGILSRGQSSINERITKSIIQAFNQSPYL